MKPYTYLIISKIDQSFYFGVRYAKNADPSDLWRTYFSSSKLVKKQIEEFGKNSFRAYINKTFDSVDDALKWEIEILKRTINHPKSLNGHIAGAFHPKVCSKAGKKGGVIGGKKAQITHRKNKTGFFREDKKIQKLGNKSGCKKGGVIGGKKAFKEKIGIFAYTKEEKSRVCRLGGKVSGSKNGKILKEEKRGIFDPVKRKEYCSAGGKAQKGFKKHFHETKKFKMAKPETEKSKKLLSEGYYLK